MWHQTEHKQITRAGYKLIKHTPGTFHRLIYERYNDLYNEVIELHCSSNRDGSPGRVLYVWHGDNLLYNNGNWNHIWLNKEAASCHHIF